MLQTEQINHPPTVSPGYHPVGSHHHEPSGTRNGIQSPSTNGVTVAASLPPCTLLRVSGESIVDANGAPIILKGAGLGGHLNMENFITGFPGHEHQFRAAMAATLGPDKAAYFFDRYLHHFFTEADAALLASLGLNCVRVPFNYRHFIDDAAPGQLKPDGFAWLDRVVNICAAENLYVVLDLHSVPGGQNQDWHCDSGHSKALFWEYGLLQDQMTALWVEIAKHYKGNPVVAGYNLLNEPADEQHTRLLAWYDKAERAIRAADPDHMLFVEGNTYSMDFSRFPDDRVLPNTVYACHDYSKLGFPIAGQKPYVGSPEQKAKLRSQFGRKVAFMRARKVPVWNGEFGPVYADDGAEGSEATNASRFALLKEQLRIYAETDTHWTIWLYKDIGHQGMVHLDRASEWMRLIAPLLRKKQDLALDFWGAAPKDGRVHADVYAPLFERLRGMVPAHLRDAKYPKIFPFERQFERVLRECLLSEYAVMEFAELFEGMSLERLDGLARSFRLENCVERRELNQILRIDAAKCRKNQ